MFYIMVTSFVMFGVLYCVILRGDALTICRKVLFFYVTKENQSTKEFGVEASILMSHSGMLTVLYLILMVCDTGRVSVTALTKKQRKEHKRMDRRHKANQLRRNKKDMVSIFIYLWCE